jgi:hypothetical protein
MEFYSNRHYSTKDEFGSTLASLTDTQSTRADMLFSNEMLHSDTTNKVYISPFMKTSTHSAYNQLYKYFQRRRGIFNDGTLYKEMTHY